MKVSPDVPFYEKPVRGSHVEENASGRTSVTSHLFFAQTNHVEAEHAKHADGGLRCCYDPPLLCAQRLGCASHAASQPLLSSWLC